MKDLIIIAAIGKNRELGKDNDLIWHIKEDMKFFKDKTINHHIVMGRKTFESLPKMLPNRIHIVITHNGRSLPNEVVTINNMEEFFHLAKIIDDDIYVIGGAKVYKEFYPYANKMYLTEIEDDCLSADVYFPEINNNDWNIQEINNFTDSKPQYKRKIYTRKEL